MSHGETLQSSLKKALGDHSTAAPTDLGQFWLPTGSLLLDLMIRGGKSPTGLPGGKVTELYGPPSGGKTALAHRVGAECQRQGGSYVYLNAERGFNLDQARLCGVDPDPSKFHYGSPFSMDNCFAAIEEITEKVHDSALPTVVCVDSISALNPIEHTMDHQDIKKELPAASGAKTLHQFFRRGFLWYAEGSKIVYIFISHQTQNPRPYSPDMTPHGCAVEFYAHLRLKMSRKDLDDPYGGGRLGSWLTCRVKKNKSGPLHGECSFPYYYLGGFNRATENISYLIGAKVLEKSKNGRVDFSGKGYYIRDLRDEYFRSEEVRATIDQMVTDTYLRDREA